MSEVKEKVTLGKLQTGQALFGNYLSWLFVAEDGPRPEDKFPKEMTVCHDKQFGVLSFKIKHGRTDKEKDVTEGLGFDGPTFECVGVHYLDGVITLRVCTEVSLELARRLGLEVVGNDIRIHYVEDMMEVKNFRNDGGPAYFGDFVITAL